MFLGLYSIFRFSGHKSLPFLNGKTKCFTENISKSRFPDSLIYFRVEKLLPKLGIFFPFQGAASYSEPCQTYEMERFANISNSWKLLTFCWTLHLRYFTELWIHLWGRPTPPPPRPPLPSLHSLLLSESLARKCKLLIVVRNFKGVENLKFCVLKWTVSNLNVFLVLFQIFKLLFFVFTIKSNGTSFSIHQKLLWVLSTTIIQDYQFKYILHCLCMFYPEFFLFSAPKALPRSFFLFNCFLNLRTFRAPHLEETLELLTLPKTAGAYRKISPLLPQLFVYSHMSNSGSERHWRNIFSQEPHGPRFLKIWNSAISG